jgi:hypothetical protein
LRRGRDRERADARAVPAPTEEKPALEYDDLTVLLFRPNAVPQPLRGQDAIDVAEVLPGFELRAGELCAVLKAD